MSIGEIAGHFGLATHVLRHWETMGLLSPERAGGGRRRYGRSDLYRVAGIQSLVAGRMACPYRENQQHGPSARSQGRKNGMRDRGGRCDH
jgi:hypothetical protein